VDRRDGSQRPADEQQAPGPGAFGGQGPVAVAGPPAEAQLAPGGSPLGSATGTPFEPVSVAPPAIAHRRWSRWQQYATLTEEDPQRKTSTTRNRTPVARSFAEPGTTQRHPGPARSAGRAAQERRLLCPSSEGPNSSDRPS